MVDKLIVLKSILKKFKKSFKNNGLNLKVKYNFKTIDLGDVIFKSNNAAFK